MKKTYILSIIAASAQGVITLFLIGEKKWECFGYSGAAFFIALCWIDAERARTWDKEKRERQDRAKKIHGKN